jgi:predicted nucleotidyltransferase component of viral defense system
MIFMDLSFDELLCLVPQSRRLVTAPFLDSEREVLTYPLEELLAEKMRSLLQRGKSRDYYDVWRLLKEQPSKLDFALLGTVLLKKLTHKGLTLHDMRDFLPKDTRGLKRYWEEDLKQQVTSLPPLDDVLEELRQMLGRMVGPYLTSAAKDVQE